MIIRNNQFIVFSVFVEGLSRDENVARHNAVAEMLMVLGIPYKLTHGTYCGTSEFGFLMAPDQFDFVTRLCKQAQQYCFFESTGTDCFLHYTYGRKIGKTEKIGRLVTLENLEALPENIGDYTQVLNNGAVFYTAA